MKPWEQMEFESVASRPASPEVIQSFEKLMGNNLPGEYRAFVLAVNGGRPVHPTAPHPDEYPVVSVDWQGRPPADSAGMVIVDYLLSAEDWADTYQDGKNDSLTLAGCYRVFALEEPRIPRGFIPIGTDPGGSLFLLDVGGKRPGSVWFWSRDWFDYDLWDKDPFQNVGFVAPSFSAFMEQIRFKTID